MMTKTGFHALAAEHQAQYLSILEAHGHDLDEALNHHIDTSQGKRPYVLTSDLQRTHILPVFKVLRNIAELKRVAGVPDHHFESGNLKDTHIDYPAPWDDRLNRLIDRADSSEHLHSMLTQDHRKAVRKAAQAYVLGHSKHAAAASYEPIINATMFPTLIASFAGNTLYIKAGDTYTIAPPEGVTADPQNPYVVTFADITIEETGQLLFAVPTALNVTGTFAKVPKPS